MTQLQSTASLIEDVEIAAIRVERRRREDLGDIAALARNINEHGLLHPIIVAADNTLIAGERRLQACRQLGYRTIPIRRWPMLTDEERREIELAENLDRKDLTAAERSRNMVALAETAAVVLASTAKTSNGGRPPKLAASEAKIADRLGVSQRTINNATRHVAAIDAYPELTPLPQVDALKIASKLDAMPEPERVQNRAAVIAHEPATLARLTDRPPMPNGPSPHERAAKDPAVRFHSDMYALWQRLNGVRDHGGIGVVITPWTPEQKYGLLADVQRIAELMAEWRETIKEQLL